VPPPAVSAARPWEKDPDVVFGSWEGQGKLAERPLIGVLRTDGLITPLPPVARVIEETVQALRNSGYDVVEMDAPAFKKIQSLANKFFGIEGGNHMFDLLEKTEEPLVTWLSGRLRRKKPIDLKTLLSLHAQKTELETEMLKVWTDLKTGRTIDAFICPVAPHPVPPIDRWNGVSYTVSMVFLDYAAGTLPVRDFVESDSEGEVEGTALNGWDKVNQELWNRNTIDRSLYLNTKLSIQVVAPKLQERRLYQAMQLIEHALHSQTQLQRAKI